jgi:hypothetical protein
MDRVRWNSGMFTSRKVAVDLSGTIDKKSAYPDVQHGTD